MGSNSASRYNNPYRYAGEYFDYTTGQYYLRARFYSPRTGRFLSQDTVLGEYNNPLSLHLYTFVKNNPLTYVDPTGQAGKVLHDIGTRAEQPDEVYFVNGINYEDGDPYPMDFVDELDRRGYDAEWFPAYGQGFVQDVSDFRAEIEVYSTYLNNQLASRYCQERTQGMPYACPAPAEFTGGPFSTRLAQAILESPPAGKLRLIGYSGGGSVVLNAALILLDNGIDVTSIDLFGAPANPALVKELLGRGVQITHWALQGDTTSQRESFVTAGFGLGFQQIVNGGVHSDYFREYPVEMANYLSVHWLNAFGRRMQ